jgi:hypothetical protein
LLDHAPDDVPCLSRKPAAATVVLSDFHKTNETAVSSTRDWE